MVMGVGNDGNKGQVLGAVGRQLCDCSQHKLAYI